MLCLSKKKNKLIKPEIYSHEDYEKPFQSGVSIPLMLTAYCCRYREALMMMRVWKPETMEQGPVLPPATVFG
jgi:hypothetical protein